jgi:signal transduction histidine kinase
MAASAPALGLHDRYWTEVGRERTSASVRATAWMALGLQLAFSFLDYYAYPEAFPQFLAMRMAVNLLLCGIIVRGHASHPTASMLALTLAVGVEILAMVYATHAPTSDYYVGLIILFVGMPVLLPLSAGHAAAICGAITLGFALAPLVTPAPIPWKEFTIRLVFLLTGCVESVLSCAFLGRVRLQDYAQRREIEKARDDLKEMDRARSRFTANVHHELRTPLTLMLAPIEAMESGEFGEVPELQRGYLKTMQVNGLRLLKLINNLLDLAKIESQQLELHCRPVELSRLASDIVSGAGPMAERKGIRLVGDGLDELPAMHADPDALEKILTNLLGNALKFTDGGGCITLAGSVEEANIHWPARWRRRTSTWWSGTPGSACLPTSSSASSIASPRSTCRPRAATRAPESDSRSARSSWGCTEVGSGLAARASVTAPRCTSCSPSGMRARSGSTRSS